MTLDERFEQLMKINAEKDTQLEYLKKQLDYAMRNNRRDIQSSHSISEPNSDEDEIKGNPFASSEDSKERRPESSRRGEQVVMDFKLEISKFKGQLNPAEFIDWMNTVDRVFEYKDVRDDEMVKLVALKLHKYAFIWCTNILSKRVRKGKGKIRS